MQQLLEFIGNHWFLFLALVVILGLLIHNLIVGGKGSVGPLQATEMLNHRDAVVIDVRTAAEYQAGHLPDAINIPLPELARGIGRHVPDKSRPVLLHCASGARSAAGKKLLERLGYASVHHLGSFSRARSLLAG